MNTRNGYRIAITAVAPIVLAAGYIYHPHLPDMTDASAVGMAAAENTVRWAIAHLLVAVGSGFLALAFIAIRDWLSEAGEERWSDLGLPFVIMGSTLFAVLPGMEFAVIAAIEVGADAAAAQMAIDPWFVPTLVTGSAIFAVGIAGFTIGIARSGILDRRLGTIVCGALVVTAAVRFVPVGPVIFYLGGAATVLALWTIAYEMWRQLAYQTNGQVPRYQAG